MKQLLLICAVALVGCGGGTLDLTAQPELEKAIREHLAETRGSMPTGELTKEDFDKVTELEMAIDLSNAGLLKEVVKLSQLTSLNLQGNKLTEVPKELEKLAQLTSLNLNDNQLTDVKGLEKLTKLEELYLSDNKLADVKGLENLTQLTRLYLFNNKLTDVKGLEKLTQLEKLSLGLNQLTEVPKGLEKLTQLEWLVLNDNPDLTKAQIDELQKALPKCEIFSNPTK